MFHTPVAIRFLESDWSQHRTVMRWTYSQESQHKILLLTFSCEYAYQTFFERWRAVSNALGRLIKHHPKINFTDVPVDISDCNNSSVSENTFRFAKLLNDPHDLIPNPYLLEKRKRFLPHTHWKKKNSLYFRGAITGQLQSLENPRVAACLAAKQIPDADCKLTSFPQTTASLVNEIKTRKLSAKKDKVFALNKHRYLLDIDGNTSSWHRFLLTDTFGCVPIRFETQWIECWHKHLKVNHSFVPATRHTLTEDIDSLRKQPDKAIFIARNASSITRKFCR